MKQIKYFLVALIVLAFASCGEDKPSMNTAPGVTVELSQDTVYTKEGRRIAKVPFKILGEANGDINLTFRVTEVSIDTTEEAFEDVHYYVTSKSVRVTPEDNDGYMEFTIYNDRVPNNPRTFIVDIESAQGAVVGTNSQTICVIRDNDTDPYDRLGGIWYLSYLNGDEVRDSVRVTIEPPLEDDAMYHMVLPMVGDYLSGEGTIYLRYLTDDSGKGIGVGITGGSVMAENVGFGEYGSCNIVTGFVSGGGYTTKGYLRGNWNDDFTEVTFGNGDLGVLVMTTANSTGILGPNVLIGAYDFWHDIKLRFFEDIQ